MVVEDYNPIPIIDLPEIPEIPRPTMVVDRYMWCLRVRSKKMDSGEMYRVNNDGLVQIASWNGKTKMPPWMKAKGEKL